MGLKCLNSNKFQVSWEKKFFHSVLMFWKFAITFLNGVIPTVKCEWLTRRFAIEK